MREIDVINSSLADCQAEIVTLQDTINANTAAMAALKQKRAALVSLQSLSRNADVLAAAQAALNQPLTPP